MEAVTDKLETLILMALEAEDDCLVETGSRFCASKKNNNMKLVEYDAGAFLGFDDMSTKSAYTFDMTDNERLIGTGPEFLISHPADIIGDEKEIIMLDESGAFKWCGYRKTRKPRNVFSIGKASVWYEAHWRQIRMNGARFYAKRVIPLDAIGNPLPAFFQNTMVGNPKIDGFSLISSCSIIEDAHRSNSMLASAKDAKEIMFPVPLDDYKNVFAERDGPMNGSRRKAIVHWVARHLRHSARGKEFTVKKHTRGVQEFTIDGLRIRLTPNARANGQPPEE